MPDMRIVPRTPATLVLAALLGASATSSSANETIWEQRLSLAGLGDIRIGMHAIELAKLGYRVELPNSQGWIYDDPESCYQAELVPNSGVWGMFEHGVLTRLDITSSKIKTLSGAGLGMRTSELQTLYPGRLKAQPHFYLGSEGQYLTLFSREGRHAIVFEVDGDLVSTFRSGLAASVQYVEGCL